MIVLGLTGSIGMGKSTAAAMLRRLGVRLFDADAVVHQLLGPGGKAVAAVEALFPGVRDETGAIDRRLVGQRVFGDPAALRRLEAILHPMVRRAETRFVRQARARARQARRARHPAAVRDRRARPRRLCARRLGAGAGAARAGHAPARHDRKPFREHSARADAGPRKAPAGRFRRADRARARVDVPPVAAGRRRAAACKRARKCRAAQDEGRQCAKS